MKVRQAQLKGYNVHQFKYDILGKNAKISRYNVYKEKGDPNSQLYLKIKEGDPVETYTNMNDFKASYPDEPDPTVIKLPDIFDWF